MNYKTFLMTAVLAAACTQVDTIAPEGVAKGGSTEPQVCEYRAVIDAISVTASCEEIKDAIEPCAKLLCKHDLAAAVDFADAHALANSFGPCDWSWLPEGTPCE